MTEQSKHSPAVESRLGFGCSNLGSDLGHRASCALLDAALECGFRYFDTAPPYGHGESERIVGKVLRPVRDQVTIATKVGIRHPTGTTTLRLAKRALSPIKTFMPGLWSRGAGKVRAASAARGKFSPQDIRASLEESLRRLQMERIDWLLLHGAQPEDIDDEVLSTLAALRAEGKVVHLGLGTSIGPTRAILARNGSTFSLVQCNHYWAAFDPDLGTAPKLNTHRSIRTGLSLIGSPQFLSVAPPSLRAALSDEKLAADLLLAAALKANPSARILVSSSNPSRVRRFASTASQPGHHELTAQLNSAFRQLARTMPSPEP